MMKTRLAALLCCLAGAAAAADTVKLPIHQDAVYGAAVNAENNLLLTASSDGTAKLWEIAGRQIRLVHSLPVPDNHGQPQTLLAAAIDSKGRWLAAAGDGAAVYLFAPQTGELLQRLPTDRTVNALCESADGSRLAAGGYFGIIQWNTANWQPISSHSNDAGSISSCAYDGLALLTASSAGQIARYKEDGSLEKKQTLPARQFAAQLVINPVRRQFAAGTQASRPFVLLGDAAKLTLQPALALPDSERSLRAVSWSLDGKTLYAAGSYQLQNGIFPIAAQPAAGGQPVMLAGTKSNVLHVFALGSGDILSIDRAANMLLQNSAGEVFQTLINIRPK